MNISSIPLNMVAEVSRKVNQLRVDEEAMLHLFNILREPLRRISCIADVCVTVIYGPAIVIELDKRHSDEHILADMIYCVRQIHEEIPNLNFVHTASNQSHGLLAEYLAPFSYQDSNEQISIDIKIFTWRQSAACKLRSRTITYTVWEMDCEGSPDAEED